MKGHRNIQSWTQSLAFKMIVQFGLATFFIIGVSLLVYSWGSRRIIEKRLQTDALFVSESLAAALTPLLNRSDISAAQRLIENIAAIPLIASIDLIDTGGHLVVSNRLVEVGNLRFSSIARDVFEFNRLQAVEITENKYTIAVPVKGDTYIRKYGNDINWVLLVGIDVEYEDRFFSYLQRTTAVQSIALFLILTALMLVLLYRSIFIPFRHLSNAARKIESGEFTFEIRSRGTGEIGEFIEAFNRMAEAVRNREQRIIHDAALIEEGRQRFELAIEGSDAGVWDWDVPSGTVVFSDRWATMLGYRPDEIEGHVSSWEKLLHPDDIDFVQRDLNDHLTGKTLFYQTVHRLLTKSGEWVWIQDSGRVVSRDTDDKPIRMIGTHINVDSKTRNEMELSRYRETLEEMVEEQTNELKAAQNELINRAIESGRAQLSAMILHNIGNAMTPVSVQIEELNADEKGSNILKYFQQVYKDLSENTSRLTEYVTSDDRGRQVFAYFGKLIDLLETNQLGLSTSLGKISEAISYISEIVSLQQNYAATAKEMNEQVDLHSLLNDALKMQSSALTKRGIQVDFQREETLPKLIIDKNRLMQVVVNLIKNSYEAIDEMTGGESPPFIDIRTFTEGSYIGLEIRDSGIGVEQDRIHKLLEFGQSGKGSSGFGLYYCKMFVEANRGVFEFSSEGRGKGALVRLLFNTAPREDLSRLNLSKR